MDYTIALLNRRIECTKFAINGIAWFGHLLLPHYVVHLRDGSWFHQSGRSSATDFGFGIEYAISQDIFHSSTFPLYTKASIESEEARNQILKQEEMDFINLVARNIWNITKEHMDLADPSQKKSKLDEKIEKAIAVVLQDFLDQQEKANELKFTKDIAAVIQKHLESKEKGILGALATCIERLILCNGRVEKGVYEDFAEDDRVKSVAYFYAARGKTYPSLTSSRFNAKLSNSDYHASLSFF